MSKGRVRPASAAITAITKQLLEIWKLKLEESERTRCQRCVRTPMTTLQSVHYTCTVYLGIRVYRRVHAVPAQE
jgi:hypothetical protein